MPEIMKCRSSISINLHALAQFVEAVDGLHGKISGLDLGIDLSGANKGQTTIFNRYVTPHQRTRARSNDA